MLRRSEVTASKSEIEVLGTNGANLWKKHIFTPSTLEHSRKYKSTKTHISLTIREILSHIMILLENPTVYSKGNESETGK